MFYPVLVENEGSDIVTWGCNITRNHPHHPQDQDG